MDYFFLVISFLVFTLIVCLFCYLKSQYKQRTRHFYTPGKSPPQHRKPRMSSTRKLTAGAGPYLETLARGSPLSKDTLRQITDELPSLIEMEDLPFLVERIESRTLACNILPQIALGIPVDKLDLEKLAFLQVQCKSELEFDSQFLRLLMCKFGGDVLREQSQSTACPVERDILESIAAQLP